MSVVAKFERVDAPFLERVRDMVGKVIFDYTGIVTTDSVNAIILAFLILFAAVLAWAFYRPHESVYHYDLRR